MGFTFNPVTGLNDVSQFPAKDPLIRQHLQTLLQQIPTYFDPLMNKKTLLSSRAVNTAGGAVYNLGFKPKFIKIHATLSTNVNYDSDGSYDNTNYSVLYRYGNGTLISTSPNFIICLHSGSNVNIATVSAISDTGFTLNWVITGTLPTDTILLKIEAFG